MLRQASSPAEVWLAEVFPGYHFAGYDDFASLPRRYNQIVGPLLDRPSVMRVVRPSGGASAIPVWCAANQPGHASFLCFVVVLFAQQRLEAPPGGPGALAGGALQLAAQGLPNGRESSPLAAAWRIP